MTFIQKSAVAVAGGLAVVAVVVAAVGATDSPRAVITGPPPSVPPLSPGSSILLNSSKDGASVRAGVGELVIVHLAGRGTMRWSAIRVSQTEAVLERRSASLSPMGTSGAVYRVTQRGTAKLSATGAPICAPGVPCPQFIVLWQASVIVAS